MRQEKRVAICYPLKGVLRRHSNPNRKDENDTIVLDEKDEHKIENNTIVIE